MHLETNIIKENIERVLNRISQAANISGRKFEDIQLVAVSKSQSLNAIRFAINAGLRVFGENYPEEAVQKIGILTESTCKWHMIGHLQSRKTLLVAQNFHYFHALDSLRLANKLNQKLKDLSKDLPVLLEINISDEASKTGWRVGDNRVLDDLFKDIDHLVELNSLHIQGLMTMPPYSQNPEMSRPYFRKIIELQAILKTRYPWMDWSNLSMGTSSDFEVAIQEGATYIRVGQAIFGPRL